MTVTPLTPRPAPSATRRSRALKTRLTAVCAAGLLATTLAAAQPAAAASTPPQVGLVSFVAASLTGTKTATLKLNWPRVPGATSYEVKVSRSIEMTSPKLHTSKSTTFTLSSLMRKTNYFVQVRAKNGSKVGSWSSRSGHRTISAQGSKKAQIYNVVTYNLCSMYCKYWSTRAPYVASRISELKPDVVMLQESSRFHNSFGDGRIKIPGYSEVVYYGSKSLLYNTARFTVAPTAEGRARTGRFLLRTPSNGDAKKYAVWADLIDRRNGKHIFFVSVHLSPGKTETAAKYRRTETTKLLSLTKSTNTDKYPVVFGGDFNSHKNRTNDYVSAVMRTNKYDDAFDEAMRLTNQHNNSYGGFDTKPRVGVTWGDHVDHVWVNPSTSRVLSWANAGKMAGGQYTTPVPSDHRPVQVRIKVN